jgi:hypothetical protein
MGDGAPRSEFSEPDECGDFDAPSVAEAIFAGLLGLVCASAPARRRLGLKGASRRADGWPAWYIWLADTPGAYEIALLRQSGDRPTQADLALRYYPHPDEAVFATFAPVEQSVRLSALFDRTGTPAIEALDQIDPSLFHIAILSVRPIGTETFDVLLQAQDRWLEIATHRGGEAARRSVPGLTLAATVLDFLVSAYAYHNRRPPGAVTITRQPGLVWRVGAGGEALAAAMPDVSLFSVHVSSLARLGAAAADADGAQSERDELPANPNGAAVVFRHQGTRVPAPFAPFALPAWWEAAAWRFYPIGAVCGCHMDAGHLAGRDEEPSEAFKAREAFA